ncbi:MAG: hypothetical protein IMZ47_03135 [Firmicutes bacterium]|nr:hypothetical protein [Bacillota bacterium]
MSTTYNDHITKWAAKAERLHRIGIHPFGFDPGCICTIEGCSQSVDMPMTLVDILNDLIKKAYPETQNDAAMIEAYKRKESTKKVVQ